VHLGHEMRRFSHELDLLVDRHVLQAFNMFFLSFCALVVRRGQFPLFKLNIALFADQLAEQQTLVFILEVLFQFLPV